MPDAARPAPRLFLDARAELVESPVWDADHGVLWWTDITRGQLHRTTVDGQDDVRQVDPPLPSFQLREGGGFVAALEDRVVVLEPDGTEATTLATVEHAHDGMRFNEGKCDPFGAFVVGSMDDEEGAEDGLLYRVTGDGGVVVLADGFGTTNGLEWDDEGSVVYVTDTGDETIYRAPYGPNGITGDLEPFTGGSAHDGLVRDSLGDFWGAVFGEGVVVHLDPEGRLVEKVAFPVPQLTGIAFGGDDLRTLFVGSSREGMDDAALAEHPTSGGVFAVEVDRAGLPPHRFAAGTTRPSGAEGAPRPTADA